jgi:hypothetical protein
LRLQGIFPELRKRYPRRSSAYQGLNLFYVDEAEMKLGDYIVGGMADLISLCQCNEIKRSNNHAVISFLNAGYTPYDKRFDDERGSKRFKKTGLCSYPKALCEICLKTIPLWMNSRI